ncbi:MAG TPA: hypothetical protein VFW07_07925 [Parafilimonas sp.]|nr:hypothetical protein [Parafilimonas sp.]
MPGTNVELSKNESELVINSEFILTKNRIIEKVYTLFGLLSEDYKSQLLNNKVVLPSEALSSTPKIYKGENYLNLPYVMLDYPRVFLKEDVFAIRSFFWWGNYFSITLQLGGRFLQAYRNKIEMNLSNEINTGYFICINDAPWEHHFEESNYQSLKAIDSIETILNKPFIKIAKQHPLSEWNNAIAFYESNYENLLQLMY